MGPPARSLQWRFMRATSSATKPLLHLGVLHVRPDEPLAPFRGQFMMTGLPDSADLEPPWRRAVRRNCEAGLPQS